MAEQTIETFDDRSMREIADVVRASRAAPGNVRTDPRESNFATYPNRQLRTAKPGKNGSLTYPAPPANTFFAQFEDWEFTETAEAEQSLSRTSWSDKHVIARGVDGLWIPEGVTCELVRFPGGDGSRRYYLDPTEEPGVTFYNSTSEEIPAYAIMRVVDDSPLPDSSVVKVAKPNDDIERQYLVNRGRAVPAGEYAWGDWQPQRLAVNGDDYSAGDTIGPKSGYWEAHPCRRGFWVAAPETYSGGSVLATQVGLHVVAGKALADVAAYDASGSGSSDPPTGTADIYATCCGGSIEKIGTVTFANLGGEISEDSFFPIQMDACGKFWASASASPSKTHSQFRFSGNSGIGLEYTTDQPDGDWKILSCNALSTDWDSSSDGFPAHSHSDGISVKLSEVGTYMLRYSGHYNASNTNTPGIGTPLGYRFRSGIIVSSSAISSMASNTAPTESEVYETHDLMQYAPDVSDGGSAYVSGHAVSATTIEVSSAPRYIGVSTRATPMLASAGSDNGVWKGSAIVHTVATSGIILDITKVA